MKNCHIFDEICHIQLAFLSTYFLFLFAFFHNCSLEMVIAISTNQRIILFFDSITLQFPRHDFHHLITTMVVRNTSCMIHFYTRFISSSTYVDNTIRHNCLEHYFHWVIMKFKGIVYTSENINGIY